MKICSNCGSDKTYIAQIRNWKPYPQWYKHNDNWYCQKCNSKLFHNPKYNAKTNARWGPINSLRQLGWKPIGRQIHVKENPRKGYCSLCPNNIYDGSCKRTHIHHFIYDDNPLKHIIELCASCHRKMHILV